MSCLTPRDGDGREREQAAVAVEDTQAFPSCCGEAAARILSRGERAVRSRTWRNPLRAEAVL